MALNRILIFFVFLVGFNQSILASPIAFFGEVGTQIGLGNHSSANELTVKRRDMFGYGVDLNAGISWSFLQVGVGFDYVLWDQLKDPKEVENINTYGNQQSLNLLVGITYTQFQFLLKSPLTSVHKLTLKDQGGQSLSYSNPENSVNIQLRYRLGKAIYFGLQRSTSIFTKETRGTNEATLESANKIIFSGWGFVSGYTF